MLRKQNRDPNRSIGVKSSSSNKLCDKKQHNNSINTISSTIQYYPVQKQPKQRQGLRQKNNHSRILAQKNKNSRILAQIKQSKQCLLTKRQATAKSSNISTTRTNYKPKFILKQLMSDNYNNMEDNEEQQQEEDLREENQDRNSEDELESHERQSMCENYVLGRDKFQSIEDGRGNGSDTFNNNSPIGSETFAMNINKRNNNFNQLSNNQNISTNKSAILNKKTQLQHQETTWRNTFQQIDYDNIKNLNKPIQMSNMFNKKRQKTSQTEESLYQQKDLFLRDGEEYETYEQASTVEYPLKLFSKQPRQQVKSNKHNNFEQESQQSDDNYQFQSKIRSISSTNPCRPWQQQQNNHHQPRSVSPLQNPNYKTSYLQTKKQLQIRSAYFNQAIELCKHIIGNMKQALGEEYDEGKSERVLWCYERCEDVLGAFQTWMER